MDPLANPIDPPNRLLMDPLANLIDPPNRLLMDPLANLIDPPNRLQMDPLANPIVPPNRPLWVRRVNHRSRQLVRLDRPPRSVFDRQIPHLPGHWGADRWVLGGRLPC